MSTILNQQFSVAAVPIVTTTETAVMSTPALFSGQQTPVYVGGSFRFTPGTGATAVTLRIRQGANAVGAQNPVGTVLYTSPALNVVAGNPISVPLDMLDATGVINGAPGTPYTVSLQQTAATANGSVNDNYFRVEQ